VENTHKRITYKVIAFTTDKVTKFKPVEVANLLAKRLNIID